MSADWLSDEIKKVSAMREFGTRVMACLQSRPVMPASYVIGRDVWRIALGFGLGEDMVPSDLVDVLNGPNHLGLHQGVPFQKGHPTQAAQVFLHEQTESVPKPPKPLYSYEETQLMDRVAVDLFLRQYNLGVSKKVLSHEAFECANELIKERRERGLK